MNSRVTEQNTTPSRLREDPALKRYPGYPGVPHRNFRSLASYERCTPVHSPRSENNNKKTRSKTTKKHENTSAVFNE